MVNTDFQLNNDIMPSRVLSNDNYKENGAWLLACFWFIKYDFYIMK